MTLEMRDSWHRRCAGWFGLVLLTIACSACQRIADRALYGSGKRLETELRALEQASRIVVITYRGRTGPVATITDRTKIRDLVAFFEERSDGWLIFSGVIPGYDFVLYRDDRLLGHLGLTASSSVRPGEDTLSVGDYFRRVPFAETAALANRLGLSWPPP